MTELELCNFLLGLKNVRYFAIHNIGSDDVYALDGHSPNVPIITVRYLKAVETITDGHRRADFTSATMIPEELQEPIINLLYPYIEMRKEQGIDRNGEPMLYTYYHITIKQIKTRIWRKLYIQTI